MSRNRKDARPGDADSPAGGVFVLRAWVGPDDEVVGRLQWSIDDGEVGEPNAYVIGTNAILREMHAFVERIHARGSNRADFV